MQLPVPYDAPLHQIMQYPQNQPPCLPQVLVLPQAQQYLVPIASACANTASQAAMTSPIKMFCYNFLSQNNWNNQNFAEFVKLTADNLMLKHHRNPSINPMYEIGNAVTEVLDLYASYIASQFPALIQIVGPSYMGPINNNVRLFHELRNLTQNMYAGGITQHPQGGMIPSMQSPQQPYYGHRFHSQPAPMNPAAVALSSGNAFGHTTQPMHFDKFSVNIPKGKPITQTTCEPITKPTQGVQQSAPHHPPVEKVVFNDIVTGEQEMDRQKHSIVYRGMTFAIEQTPPKQQFEKAVTDMEKAIEAEQQDPELYEGCSYLNRCIDSVIQVMRSRYSGKVTEKPTIYMNEGEVVTPIISSIPFTKIFEEMALSKNFITLAVTLRNHLKEMSRRDPQEFRLTRAWVSEVDRYLTRMVNAFLEYSGPRPGVEIESFIEDIEDLGDLLQRKYHGKMTPRYAAFQRNLMGALFLNVGKDALDIPELDEGDGSERNYNILTQRIGLYYLTMSSDELTYNITKEPKRVVVNETPMLHRLMSSIFHRKRNAEYTHHILITLDGKRFGMYESAMADGSFTIVEE